MTKLTGIVGGGVLGGLAIMIVAFALHRPPLDDIGWLNLPESPRLRSNLTAAIGDRPGLYIYPPIVGITARDDAAPDPGPSGFLVYQPAGSQTDIGKQMAEETIKTIVIAMLASVLLAQVGPGFSYLKRVGFVATIGGMVSTSTHVSDHIWFGFPASYEAARVLVDFCPWIAASLVIAALVRPSPSL